MTQPERIWDQESETLERYELRLARIALFNELIDYALDGQCSFDEAVNQYLHDASLLAEPAEAG